LAFDNANEDCQSLIRPIKETGDIMDYLKACRNVGIFKHKARVAALETMAIQKQKTAKCFNCGKPGHMKKQCKLLAQNNNYNRPGNPSLPGICTRCKKGWHWVKECRSKTDRESNLLPIKYVQLGNKQRGHPQAPTSMRATLFPVQMDLD
jgi:hypothetical protein